MREINLSLPDLHRQYLAQEAADCGVAEGDIVTLALSLLALHRQTARADGGFFASADRTRPAEQLSINAEVVDAPNLRAVGRSERRHIRRLRLGLDTIDGDDGPHLRLV